MALDFPNSPSDGQVYTDTATGEQWVYEAATNSWTSKGLVNTSGGLVYKGTVDITAAPPASVSSGWQYSVLADGTANAGFGPGITGAVAKGTIIIYTGTGWTDTSNSVPQATAAVAGIDKKLWKRSGTGLSPEIAGDTVQISAGTAALPGLTPVGDPNTGIYSPGAAQLGISTNGTEQFRVTDDRHIRLAPGTGGIQFNGDTTAANALDDYEEGTWTPSLAFGGGSTGIAYNAKAGYYVKIGKQVFVILFFSLSSKGTDTGEVTVTGLPFVSEDFHINGMRAWPGAQPSRRQNETSSDFAMMIIENTATILCTNGSGVSVPDTAFTDGTIIECSLSYRAA